MERSEVSLHEVKVFRLLQSSPSKWFTHADIAAQVKGVAVRTIRHHTKRLVALGLLDVAEVFPAHRYRFAEKAGKRNQAMLLRLERAAEIFNA